MNIGSRIASGFSSIASSASAIASSALASLGAWATGVKGTLSNIGVSFRAIFTSTEKQQDRKETQEAAVGPLKETINSSSSSSLQGIGGGTSFSPSDNPATSVRPRNSSYSKSFNQIPSHLQQGRQVSSSGKEATSVRPQKSSFSNNSLSEELNNIEIEENGDNHTQPPSVTSSKSQSRIKSDLGKTADALHNRGGKLENLAQDGNTVVNKAADYRKASKNINNNLKAKDEALNKVLNPLKWFK